MRYLLDTNILTRLSNRSDTEHAVVAQAIHALVQQGHTLCLVPQTIYEFWTVASRPANVNGLGLSINLLRDEVDSYLSAFEFYEDTPQIFPTWLDLVTINSVSGKPTHDARLAAAYLVHGFDALLTRNTDDFKRFKINVIHPKDVS